MSATITAKLVKDIAEIRVAFQHPTEDGQRKDPKTGRFIAANFVRQFQIKADERLLTEANLGGGLSQNPQFLFKAKNLKPGARITLEWLAVSEVLNDKGRKEEKEEKGSAETTLHGEG